MLNNVLVLSNLIISVSLTVLIWIIQLVHYPLFDYLANDTFIKAMHFHQKNISLIVVPLMLVELALASYYLIFQFSYFSLLIFLVIASIWLCTFFIQVPLHQKLLLGKDSSQVQRLVRTNWIRTILWSAKLGIVLIQFFKT